MCIDRAAVDKVVGRETLCLPAGREACKHSREDEAEDTRIIDR